MTIGKHKYGMTFDLTFDEWEALLSGRNVVKETGAAGKEYRFTLSCIVEECHKYGSA